MSVCSRGVSEACALNHVVVVHAALVSQFSTSHLLNKIAHIVLVPNGTKRVQCFGADQTAFDD